MCICYEASKKLRKHFSFYFSTETKSDLQQGISSDSCVNVLWSFPRSAPEKNFPSNFFPSWNVGADNVFFFGKMRKTLRFPKISMVWANSYRAHIWKRKTKNEELLFFCVADQWLMSWFWVWKFKKGTKPKHLSYHLFFRKCLNRKLQVFVCQQMLHFC